MSTAKTIIDKIWESHIVSQQEGHPALFAIDFMLLHEVTSAQAFDMLRDRKLSLDTGVSLLATLDHSIPTSKSRLSIVDAAARKQVETLRHNVKEFDIPFLDFDHGQGIVHVVGPEFGITQPGMTIVCGDSHTSTHGAFGALAFGVGTTEVGHVLATGCLLQQRPKSMNVSFQGSLQAGVYAKDAILKLIQTIGVGGANGHVIEYTGDLIPTLSMEERMTMCNMSIECGARAGLIAPDERTIAYLKGRPCAPEEGDWDDTVQHWESFVSDPGASYDKQCTIAVKELNPVVTWGTNPAQSVELQDTIPGESDVREEERSSYDAALSYVGLKGGSSLLGVPVDWAFIGSCTNGRIEDLRIAASILEGKKVHSDVTFFVVPGSEAVRKQACEEGLDRIFTEAGADFRMPGCSMCLGMNEDKVPAGKRCISSSNRNFVGRQGSGSITHLASPATVAASALEGRISHPASYL